MSSHKNSVKKAIEGFYKRQEVTVKTPTRTNNKPEKEVEKECTDWFKANGFRYKIIEAKGVWSEARQCYTSGRVKAGTLDCQITTPDGFSGWVEFKAPGKLKTIHDNPKQLKTLKSEIAANCFACVVDSAHSLEQIYLTWLAFRRDHLFEAARWYLTSMIPDEPKRRDSGDLFL